VSNVWLGTTEPPTGDRRNVGLQTNLEHYSRAYKTRAMRLCIAKFTKTSQCACVPIFYTNYICFTTHTIPNCQISLDLNALILHWIHYGFYFVTSEYVYISFQRNDFNVGRAETVFLGLSSRSAVLAVKKEVILRFVLFGVWAYWIIILEFGVDDIIILLSFWSLSIIHQIIYTYYYSKYTFIKIIRIIYRLRRWFFLNK